MVFRVVHVTCSLARLSLSSSPSCQLLIFLYISASRRGMRIEFWSSSSVSISHSPSHSPFHSIPSFLMRKTLRHAMLNAFPS
ncbi:hypothetical protein M501DRAFT_477326 [Patellaria atrata CBS 101060]|uniref:Uncharacterized protein n=1 Tax=Patellaria atrata CBS 101060 TaxID=1346257 RepID=A0A9P4VP16_9PEZI|nr:hypothetical protein M501DRAFT_477326 [Patellaria atrata CBS 101060]